MLLQCQSALDEALRVSANIFRCGEQTRLQLLLYGALLGDSDRAAAACRDCEELLGYGSEWAVFARRLVRNSLEFLHQALNDGEASAQRVGLLFSVPPNLSQDCLGTDWRRALCRLCRDSTRADVRSVLLPCRSGYTLQLAAPVVRHEVVEQDATTASAPPAHGKQDVLADSAPSLRVSRFRAQRLAQRGNT